MITKPCLDCSLKALPNESRCSGCKFKRNQRKNTRRSKAPGNGAARKHRKLLNAMAGVLYRCGDCQGSFRGSQLEVDHVKRLADGGYDIDANLQYLCPPCHRSKTAKENAQARTTKA